MGNITKIVDYFYVIAWNIYVGSGELAARNALKEFIKAYNPHVLALMEATNLYGDLEGLGYKVYHLKPSPQRPGNIPGDADVALLVREDLKVKKSFTHRMKTFWKGPKHGFDQDPRTYRSVKVKALDKVWRVGCAHTPFGEAARAESKYFLIRWLSKALPKLNTILVLDANMGLKEFDTTIAGPGNAEATGEGVDLAAWRNCELVKKKNLGKKISDHPAMLYTFSD